MKIRTNLVSNSSSTSFVVKYDSLDFEKCKCCHHKTLTPLELVELEEGKFYSGEETQINFTGLDEYIEQIQSDLDYESQSPYKESEYVTSLQKELTHAKTIKLKATEEIIGVSASNGGYLCDELTRLIEEGVIQELHCEVNN